MKKTLIIIIAVMLVVLIGIIVGKSINETNNSIQTDSGKIENNINKVSNKDVDKKTENKAENTSSNEANNTIDNTEKEEEPAVKTDLDKAIDLVKKDWGDDDTVYFAQDGKTDNGEFIICVRDNATTGARAWYSVNVEAGTAEKWE